MSCIYCAGEIPILDTTTTLSKKGFFYPGITVGVEDGELWVTAVPDTYEPGYLEEDIKINFCPMCGEKLVHEETECAGG